MQEKASLKNKTKPHEHVDETEGTARRQSRGNDMIETNDDEKNERKKKKQDMQACSYPGSLVNGVIAVFLFETQLHLSADRLGVP